MPDIYSRIATVPGEVIAGLAQAMETRAGMPRMRAMLDDYLGRLPFAGARVLEVGCGSGAISEVLASQPDVGGVVGSDASPGLLAIARERRGHLEKLRFDEAGAASLPYADGSFDIVVMHTVLTHVPEAASALGEAARVLRPGGWLAVFDGDYDTIDVGDHALDPLARCAEMFKESFIHDRWLMRRMGSLLESRGFRVESVESYGYFETADDARGPSSYMLTIIDRGADSLAAEGAIGPELCAALKAEARRRVEDGTFFGRVDFVCFLAQRPA